MKYLKKIFIIVVSVFILLGLGYVISNAYEIGQTDQLGNLSEQSTIKLGFGALSQIYTHSGVYQSGTGGNGLYCIQHGQGLGGLVTFRATQHVTIEGNTLTKSDGSTTTNLVNGKMAYIISLDQGYGHATLKPGGNKMNLPVYTNAQKAIYHIIEDFIGDPNNISGVKVQKDTTLDPGPVLSDAENYAKSIGDVNDNNENFKDNTDKEKVKKVKISPINSNYIQVGPFNWTFPTGDPLTNIEVKDENGNVISHEKIKYSKENGNSFINVGDIESGKDFYIHVNKEAKVAKITAVGGISKKSNIITADIWFLVSGNNSQTLMKPNHGTTEKEIPFSYDYEIGLLGNLKVVKVNADNHNIKLPDVGFKFRYEDGTYLYKNSKGEISYINETAEKKGTTFKTSSKEADKGEILIEDILPGKYTAIEVNNPNYGYQLVDKTAEVTAQSAKTIKWTIENKQIYVKLSGYIWEDIQSAKQSKPNALAYENSEDNEDTAKNLNQLGKIVVELKQKGKTETIKKTTAKYTENGEKSYLKYSFKDVEIDQLKNYYIEFTYNGLLYTNVTPKIKKDNGSKAIEPQIERTKFENSFAEVHGYKDTEAKTTKNSQGSTDYTIHYTKPKKDNAYHVANLKTNMAEFAMHANTKEAELNLKDEFKAGMEEIENINLGLSMRPQTDMFLRQDLQDIRLDINGYGHTYLYNERYSDKELNEKTAWNVGVKFLKNNRYNQDYMRPIYQADASYIPQDKSQELQAYLTYKIELYNLSSVMDSRINSFVDYYDTRYDLASVKWEDGKDIPYQLDSSYNQNGYKKATIQTDLRLGTNKSKTVLIQFKLNREAILEIMNDGETLENVAEISSYTSFEKGKNTIRSAVDENSIPGNAVPGKADYYENDTEASKAVKLTVANARQVAGMVFEDKTTLNKENNERLGNGIYDAKDKDEKIKDVKVELIDQKTNKVAQVYDEKEQKWKDAVCEKTTDGNGEYIFEGYVPGKYIVRFTWGDNGKYTVQEYKGTIYNETRYNQNQNNLSWYKNDIGTRYTDALDDYALRQNIDHQMQELTYQKAEEIRNRTRQGNDTIITKMQANTLPMEFKIEYDTTQTSGLADKAEFRVENIDYGIAERANQNIELSKNITAFRVSVANESPIIDAYIDQNGKLTGQTDHVVYLRPTEKSQGFIKAELDDEILQNAKAQIEYTLTVKNTSEVDYNTKEYYLFGTNKDKDKKITITPSRIIDYLDGLGTLDTTVENQANWTKVEDVNQLIKTQNENGYEMAKGILNQENVSHLDDKNIYVSTALEKTNIIPGEIAQIKFNAIQTLGNDAETTLNNQAEIIKVTRPAGKMFTSSTPGNYVPKLVASESDDARSETSIITPSTGDNKNYTLPIVIGTTALLILGAGIYFIRKKALDK